MAEFTTEDKDYLYQIFADKDHEVREGVTTKSGKVRWFVYLERDSIVRHLDNRFFGEWSMNYHSHRDLEKYSETYCRIAIRNAYRENNGSNTANKANDENMGKGAASDAFKRAASSWGIGLYLQDAPQIWTAYDYVDNNRTDYKKRDQREKEALQQVYNWLKSLRSGQPAQHQQRPKPQVVPSPQGSNKTIQWPDDSKIDYNEKTNRRRKVFDQIGASFDNDFNQYMKWCDAQGVTWSLSSVEIIDNIEALLAS